MVDWKEFEARQQDIYDQQTVIGDVRKSLFDFPSGDATKLLEKPMNPVDSFDGIITRDVTTANITSEQQARDISFLLTSAVALNESGKLFLNTNKEQLKEVEDLASMTDEQLDKYNLFLQDYEDSVQAKKWLDATVTNIRASANSLTATSKGIKGWLGELFVTLKRRGEIQAQFIPAKKGGLIK